MNTQYGNLRLCPVLALSFAVLDISDRLQSLLSPKLIRTYDRETVP